ncbi:MAG: lactonase family protein [Chloroflexi bacterium]|nr:lactonase family protein [Chloroflexota bacterium]
MFVFVGAITSVYSEPKPPLYERPAPLPREGNMGEEKVGITVFDLDATSGELRHLQDVRGLRNPTYLAAHPAQRLLYAAERETTTWGPIEAFAGQITTLTIGSNGTLAVKDRLAIGGGATYISTGPDGRYLLAALPAPRCVMVFPIGEDGRVQPAADMVQLQGRGVNTITLERPFPHCIRPDATGKRALACDMGMDRVMVFDLNENGGLAAAPHPFAQLSSGAGPRHLWVHTNNRWIYTVNEIDSSVSAFEYDAESAALRIIGTTSTRPEGFEGHNSGAQIVVHPSGQFLYSSNRGHNSIAVFSIDPESGRPRLMDLVSTRGETPRNFNIDPSGQLLVVANVNSDNLVSFHIDQGTGQLSPTGHSASCEKPVCVMFA